MIYLEMPFMVIFMANGSLHRPKVRRDAAQGTLNGGNSKQALF